MGYVETTQRSDTPLPIPCPLSAPGPRVTAQPGVQRAPGGDPQPHCAPGCAGRPRGSGAAVPLAAGPRWLRGEGGTCGRWSRRGRAGLAGEGPGRSRRGGESPRSSRLALRAEPRPPGCGLGPTAELPWPPRRRAR